MIWRNYQVRSSGECRVRKGETLVIARYELGIIETGKSKVFAGQFIRIVTPDRQIVVGEDQHALRRERRPFGTRH